MTKLEFMKELESLLSDIPLEEREEALQYYNGYFDDAGEENEEEIIKELGSPKRVASIIKTDLNSNAQDRESRGYFTENGYQDTSVEEDRFELMGSAKKNSDNSRNEASNGGAYDNRSGSTNNSEAYRSDANSDRANNGTSGSTYGNGANYSNTYNNHKGPNVALLVLLIIFGIPFIPAFFGIVVGILGAIIGIIIGFGAAAVAMIAAGIALIIAGLIQVSVPLIALLFCGSGFLVLGLGMLFGILCIILCKNVLPAMIRGIVNLCRRPFQNRSVTA